MKYLPEFDLYIDEDCCLYRPPCRKDGKVTCSLLPVKVMKNLNGYLNVHRMINKKLHTFLVHRIIATAFIPNPENKPEIDHINRIVTDNRPSNLRWVTRQENVDNRDTVRTSDDPIEMERIEKSRSYAREFRRTHREHYREYSKDYYKRLYSIKRTDKYWK